MPLQSGYAVQPQNLEARFLRGFSFPETHRATAIWAVWTILRRDTFLGFPSVVWERLLASLVLAAPEKTVLPFDPVHLSTAVEAFV